MIRKFGWMFAAIVMFGVVSAGSGDALAAKKQKRYSVDSVQQGLRFVDELRINAKKMTAEALKFALNIEPEHSFANFKRSHDQFETVLNTLQKGDETMALPAPIDPKLLESLQNLQTVWARIGEPAQRVLASGKVTQDDLLLLLKLDSVLIGASTETGQAYQQALLAQLPFSTALNNIIKGEQLSLLVEQIKAEFLLIAYDHETQLQKRNLGESAARFELILNGLIHGDPNLHLVAAQDAEIATQLRKVELIWQEVAQTLKRTAAEGDSGDPETLHRITRHMEPLYVEMEKSIDLLERL